MADVFSKAKRSSIMASIKCHGTSPEVYVGKILHRMGFRFRKNVTSLPGHPDFVIKSVQSIVFVHGCFWHMHRCKRGQSKPRTNAAFWQAKRTGNHDRDRRTLRKLRAKGWKVLVIWECQLRCPDRLSQTLTRFLSEPNV